MGKLILAAILIAAGVIVWKVVRNMAASLAQNPREAGTARMLTLASRAALGIGLALPALIILLSTFVIIGTGHVGVVTQFAKVEPDARD